MNADQLSSVAARMGANGGTCSGAQTLRAHQYTFEVIYKRILNRNLDQKHA